MDVMVSAYDLSQSKLKYTYIGYILVCCLLYQSFMLWYQIKILIGSLTCFHFEILDNHQINYTLLQVINNIYF